MNGKDALAGFALSTALWLGAVMAQAPMQAQAQAQAQAQGSDAVTRGNAKFQHSCAPCHGPGAGDDGRAMLPGTDALRLKYRGSLPAVLEERSDLTADAIRVFVRQGSMSMPPFRPTELTDAEIVDIAAYLAESSTRPSR
jgi:mono/diheme cytochrome c family protein